MEWIQDCYHDSYEDAPSDGSSWMTDCLSDEFHELRGGDYETSAAVYLRTRMRDGTPGTEWTPATGFRCAR